MKIEDILSAIDFVDFKGNTNQEIENVIPFQDTNMYESVLMWINEKNLGKLPSLKAGIVICPSNADIDWNENVNYILVDRPRDAFRKVMEKFFLMTPKVGISKSASIDSTSSIGADCFIGNNVVIEENCIVGNSVQIDHNTVVKQGTIIDEQVIIGANCTIGGVGFGYEKDTDGRYTFMPHLGNVVIKSGVEIGNNVCIDRAVLGSTILSRNVKVDNFVHIAHGVFVDENSLLIAHAMIGGSTKIGKNVWVAPSAAIINACTVGDNALIGMGAVVIKPVEEGKVVVGNPARPFNVN
jgi:UDP-3-O-[3-hydroxymyristoyl] glucosamine N-acyltransferase